MTRDLVKSVGHSPVFKTLLQTEVRTSLMAFPPKSACLVINPITVDCYAALFNCTPVDRASDSIMAPT